MPKTATRSAAVFTLFTKNSWGVFKHPPAGRGLARALEGGGIMPPAVSYSVRRADSSDHMTYIFPKITILQLRTVLSHRGAFALLFVKFPQILVFDPPPLQSRGIISNMRSWNRIFHFGFIPAENSSWGQSSYNNCVPSPSYFQVSCGRMVDI